MESLLHRAVNHQIYNCLQSALSCESRVLHRQLNDVALLVLTAINRVHHNVGFHRALVAQYASDPILQSWQNNKKHGLFPPALTHIFYRCPFVQIDDKARVAHRCLDLPTNLSLTNAANLKSFSQIQGSSAVGRYLQYVE